MKGQSGITLIALIITVIVLLILAGVAISALGGQNGIFTRAQNAVTTYNAASGNEANALNEYQTTMDNIVNDLRFIIILFVISININQLINIILKGCLLAPLLIILMCEK